jgi:hypothetical protein
MKLGRREFLAAAAAGTACRGPFRYARNERYSNYPETLLDVWLPPSPKQPLAAAIVFTEAAGTWAKGARCRHALPPLPPARLCGH